MAATGVRRSSEPVLVRKASSGDGGQVPRMGQDEVEQRRRAMFGGGKGVMSASMGVMPQRITRCGLAPHDSAAHVLPCELVNNVHLRPSPVRLPTPPMPWSSTLNGEDETMQMMRQAVRSKMLASASAKKLPLDALEEEGGAPCAAPANARAAFRNAHSLPTEKTKTFSASMPVQAMRQHVLAETSADVDASMGHIIAGLDKLSDEQTPQALLYIEYACEKLGLNAASLPCSKKISHLRGDGVTRVAEEQEEEEEEEELSLADMVAD